MKKNLIGNPIVSIIMPSFNKVNYIEESIYSVLNQTYKNIELIIIDDCSTDGTKEVLQKFQGNSRVKINSLDFNRGGNYCRNLGFEISSGKFIIYLDADDLMSNDCIKNRVSVFEKYPNLDFIIFPIESFINVIGDKGNVWSSNISENHLKLFLQHKLPWHTSSPIFKKSFLEKTSLYDLDMIRLQDVEFYTRLLIINKPNYIIYNESSPDIFYRTNPIRSSMSVFKFKLNYLKGCFQFVHKISSLLIYSNKENYLKYLNGTIFTAIQNISLSIRNNQISNNEKEMLYNEFKRLARELKIIKLYHKLLYWIYFQISVRVHIRGLNLLFRKLIVLV